MILDFNEEDACAPVSVLSAENKIKTVKVQWTAQALKTGNQNYGELYYAIKIIKVLHWSHIHNVQ